MVSGKPSNQSARGVDIPPTTLILVFPITWLDVWEYVLPGNQEYGHVVTLQTYVLHNWCAYGPAVACGGSDPQVGMKGKRLLRDNLWMFQACEFGLPFQDWNLIQESSVSRGDWDYLIPLPHRVIRAIWWLSKMMFVEKVLPCLSSYSCLLRMNNQLEPES
jgi:hypothetical protein